MSITLHCHSGQFCRHAKGSLEELVQAYIARQFAVVGLSEHMPRYRLQDLYPEEKDLNVKDLVNLFEAYVIEARRLQHTYGSQLVILVGAETEYIRSQDSTHLLGLRSRHQLDYWIGSVHHVHEIPIDVGLEPYTRAIEACGGTLSALFDDYFEAQYEMMQTLHPEIIGHFDVVKIFAQKYWTAARNEGSWREEAWSASVLAKVARNVRYAVSYGALLELNARAWKKGLESPYPESFIVQQFLVLGGKVTLGDDAHAPEEAGLHYDKLRAFMKQHAITKVYYPINRHAKKRYLIQEIALE